MIKNWTIKSFWFYMYCTSGVRGCTTCTIFRSAAYKNWTSWLHNASLNPWLHEACVPLSSGFPEDWDLHCCDLSPIMCALSLCIEDLRSVAIKRPVWSYTVCILFIWCTISNAWIQSFCFYDSSHYVFLLTCILMHFDSNTSHWGVWLSVAMRCSNVEM